MKPCYYNEFDPATAQWLRNLIKAGHIPAGDVDERSICDVGADDLIGYSQVHLFAGIGGWALAARLAGWPDDREIWTGSAPCQPFSVAGKGAGTSDERHLWPDFFRLIRGRRPAVVMGEQVAAAVGKNWLDRVFDDLESVGYTCEAVVAPACSVNAPHRRDRLWFVANGSGAGLEEREGVAGIRCGADGAQQGQDTADNGGVGDVADRNSNGTQRARTEKFLLDANIKTGGAWDNSAWIIGHDGKARRVGTRIRRLADGLPAGMAGLRTGQAATTIQEEIEMIPLLAHGVRGRVAKLKGFGNAIVPQVAAEVIAAWMECHP